MTCLTSSRIAACYATLDDGLRTSPRTRREADMATSKTAQLTDFTTDVLGRYMCNGFDEAMHSTDKNAQRP